MDTFEAAATAVIEEASEHRGGVWLVTRGEGEGQIVLCSAGERVRIRPGERLERLDQDAVVVQLGLPDGTIYGCLAAVPDDAAGHAELAAHPPERMAMVLEAVLAGQWAAERASRRIVEDDKDGFVDVDTGLLNRLGWERAVAAEEHRHRRYGVEEVAVLSVRLDHDLTDIGAIRRAAWVLRTTSRVSDVVARVDDLEFCGLVLRGSPDLQTATTRRFLRALDAEAIRAAVSVVSAPPAASITDAWHRAVAGVAAGWNGDR